MSRLLALSIAFALVAWWMCRPRPNAEWIAAAVWEKLERTPGFSEGMVEAANGPWTKWRDYEPGGGWEH